MLSFSLIMILIVIRMTCFISLFLLRCFNSTLLHCIETTTLLYSAFRRLTPTELLLMIPRLSCSLQNDSSYFTSTPAGNSLAGPMI